MFIMIGMKGPKNADKVKGEVEHTITVRTGEKALKAIKDMASQEAKKV